VNRSKLVVMAASPVVPLAKKLASSDWKTRASAYEDLKQQIVSSNQPASLLKYGMHLLTILTTFSSTSPCSNEEDYVAKLKLKFRS